MTDLKHRRVLVPALAVILVLFAFSGSAVAAGNTSVELSPASDEIATDSTTTMDIVVTNASGGVGAVNVTVSLSPSDVATITDISLDDSAYSVEIRTNADNTSATIIGFGLDTNDSGSVVVGTVTVRGDATGTTDISMQVNALGDESGADYAVTSVDGASISVISSSDGGGGSGGGGGKTTTSTTLTTNEPTTTASTDTPTTSTTTENPISTTATQTTGSQASGFGFLGSLIAFTSAIALLFVRFSKHDSF